MILYSFNIPKERDLNKEWYFMLVPFLSTRKPCKMNPNALSQENFKEEEAFFRNISDSLLGKNSEEYRASVRGGRSRHRLLTKKIMVLVVAAALIGGLLALNWQRLVCPPPIEKAVSLLAAANEFDRPLALGVLDPERSETSNQELGELKAVARKHYEAKNYASAIPYFEKLMRVDPNERAAYLLYLAHCEAQLLELFVAREHCQEAMLTSEAGRSWDIAYVSRYYLGLIQMMQNDTLSAITTLSPLEEQEGFLREEVREMLGILK
jgi:tetratricopeptide (TPR) repeat protein